MRVVAGAIIVLAGGVMSGTGAVAKALFALAKTDADTASVTLSVGGGIIVILGFALLFTVPREEKRP
jgi:hypothetical protein